METATAGRTLRARIHERIEEAAWVEKSLYVVGFALLTAALAHVYVYAPWNPYVPYTGQVAGVIASGLVLGPGMGAASMLVYLVLGAAGLPVFADMGQGLGVFLGATAGYLFAFPIAAAITGHLSRRYLQTPDEETMAQFGLLALAGYVVLFGLGAGLLGVSEMVATNGVGLTLVVSSAFVCAVAGLLWWWSRRESTAFLARLFTGLVGVLVIYTLGWVVLVLVSPAGWTQGLAQGVIQFVPVDLAKVFVAAGASAFVLPPEGS